LSPWKLAINALTQSIACFCFDSPGGARFKYSVNFFAHYITALKRCGLGLLLIYIVYTFFDQGLTVLMESNLRSPEGATSSVFLLGALYLANNIFFTTLATIAAIYGASTLNSSLLGFIDCYLNQSCIEIVRSWGRVLSWSFLLVIPGIIKYLQYMFVPFVVAMDSSYQKGEKDALKASRELFKKHWTTLVFAMIGFQVVWSYLSVDFFDAYRLFWQTPVRALLISTLEAMVFLMYILILFRVITRPDEVVENEPAV
jgi:hypothetical protein